MPQAVNIPIQGSFDVAIARNMLRRKIAEQGWLPAFRARAVAALTVMTETILLSHTSAVILLTIYDQAQKPGIELSCDMRAETLKPVWLDQARRQLPRVTDEMEIVGHDQMPRIIARVWVESEEVM